MKALPREERPREKLLRGGASSLSSEELLAILIGSGTKQFSAADLARRILCLEGGGLAGLGEITPEELYAVPGMGEARTCQVLAAVELGRRMAAIPGRRRTSLCHPRDVAAFFMEDLRYRKQEVFRVVMLNTKNEFLASEDVSLGGLDNSIAHPREVFRPAVRRSAASIILIHNHPSGNPEPSDSDLLVTERLCEAGNLLGIHVLDHLIFGDGIYVSLKEKHLM
ncbi:MAG: DNA repair protein RadC [Firmicutes bacterium]|nr:JAB domain-containing protein [Clostridiales bacterium]MBQ9932088.1 DNA repair protein RadC [Bacillota bacterium]